VGAIAMQPGGLDAAYSLKLRTVSTVYPDLPKFFRAFTPGPH